MAQAAYSEGNSLRIPQHFFIEQIQGGTKKELWTVPNGFFGRWRFIHWIGTFNAANINFRFWFINVLDPSGVDCGQIIPGIAAVGGGGGVTTSPVHELLDSTLPVLTDEVFQGAAGVQPLWDYSGFTAIWWPDSFSFVFDASGLDPADQFTNIVGMVELIEAEDASGVNLPPGSQTGLLDYLLHPTGT